MENFLFKNIRACILSDQSELPPFDCYVARVFPREDLFEISDTSHSVQCEFTQTGQAHLKSILKELHSDLNILALVGKQLRVQEAWLS